MTNPQGYQASVPGQLGTAVTVAQPDSTGAAGPILPSGRVIVLDILRGWALFGVLLVNLWEDWAAEPTGTLNVWAGRAIETMAEGCFYPLLAFLFGLGFTLQMQRATQRGERWWAIHLRRMGGLFLFGLVNWSLLPGNEILIRYSIVGCFLPLFRRARPLVLVGVAGLALFVSVVDRPLYTAHRQRQQAEIRATTSEAQRGMARAEAERARRDATAIREHGSYGEVVVFQTRRLSAFLRNVPFYLSKMPHILAMMLLGMAMAVSGLYRTMTVNTAALRTFMWWGGAIGTTGSIAVIIGAPDFQALWSRFVLLTSEPLQAFAYAAAVVLATSASARRPSIEVLSWVGRMPLTTFVMQYVINMAIFERFGLNLGHRFGPLSVLWIAPLIFAVQIVFSRWWLCRFAYGPAEWLWRSLTYLRFPRVRSTS